MPNLGSGELIIILLIVLVLFGGGRIARLGGELGSGIRSFREGLKGPDSAVEPVVTEKDKEIL